jgi:hypothetical protein
MHRRGSTLFELGGGGMDPVQWVKAVVVVPTCHGSMDEKKCKMGIPALRR